MIQQRTVCDGCREEISAFTAMMNSRIGLLDHSRLDMCDKCRDRLTEVLGVEPRSFQRPASHRSEAALAANDGDDP